MAVMTGPVVGSPVAPKLVPIRSDAPIGAQLLIPAQRGGASIAASLPIQRDRRARRARSGSTRRVTTLAVAFGISLLMWVGIIAAVMIIADFLP